MLDLGPNFVSTLLETLEVWIYFRVLIIISQKLSVLIVFVFLKPQSFVCKKENLNVHISKNNDTFQSSLS
jgi:hypothetical protein